MTNAGIATVRAQSHSLKQDVPLLSGAGFKRFSYALVVLVAVFLCGTRASGPIDFRYDGAVYYVLGTSLAEGQGFRIVS